MKNLIKMRSKIFLCLLSATLLILGSAFECPPNDPESSCLCTPSGIECNGEGVTQPQINDLAASIYSLNNPINDPSYLQDVDVIVIGETTLTELDLTFLLGYRMGQLYINENRNLVSITGPTITENSLSLELEHLTITSNKDAVLHLYELFQLAGSSVKIVNVYNNQVQQDFLYGLAQLDKLEILALQVNSITGLNGGQIKSNRLTFVGLQSNQISALGEGAFELNSVDSDYVNEVLEIYLSGNQLKDENIHPNNGLDSIGRPITLYLSGNNFEFISQNNFESFLYADIRNILDLQSNFFICDQRMKWLKDAKEFLENRVNGVFCTNDPGNTIFNTTLV